MESLRYRSDSLNSLLLVVTTWATRNPYCKSLHYLIGKMKSCLKESMGTCHVRVHPSVLARTTNRNVLNLLRCFRLPMLRLDCRVPTTRPVVTNDRVLTMLMTQGALLKYVTRPSPLAMQPDLQVFPHINYLLYWRRQGVMGLWFRSISVRSRICSRRRLEFSACFKLSRLHWVNAQTQQEAKPFSSPRDSKPKRSHLLWTVAGCKPLALR